MNERIKPALPWINVGLIIFILFSAQYLFSSVLNMGSAYRWISTGFNMTLLPGMELLRHTTLESINWFGGSEYPYAQFLKSAAVSAAALTVLLILVPWFFVRGFVHNPSEPHPSGIMWNLAAPVLIIGIAVSSFHVAQVSIIHTDNMQRAESSRTADQLRNYMMNVAFDASEWWILPEETGGGSGSFFNIDDQTLLLHNFDSFDPDHPKFQLSIEEIPSDSTMILKGVWAGPDAAEADEPVHRFKIEVTPFNDSLFRYL